MGRPTPPTSTPSIDREHLVGLAEVLELGLPLVPGDGPELVRLRTSPARGVAAGEVEIGLRPSEGPHPLDDLVGFVAPPDWAALGVVSTGRASFDGGSPVPVRTVHLVARSGAWASRWMPIEADAPLAADAADGDAIDAPGGRVDDALRRTLGLPTAPPPGSTAVLWAVQWLDALVAAAAAQPGGRRRRRSLPALLGAHPAVAVLGLDAAVLTVRGLIVEGERLAAWRDWSHLRSLCAGGRWPNSEVDAATAAWLDDGAFARWVLAAWPDLVDLHEAASVLLAPSAMGVVDDALAAWGLHQH